MSMMALVWEHFLNQKQKAQVHWCTSKAEKQIFSWDGHLGGILGLPQGRQKAQDNGHQIVSCKQP